MATIEVSHKGCWCL